MDIQTITAKRDKAAHDAKQLLATAERDGDRALTPEEDTQYTGFLKSIEDLGKKIDKQTSDRDLRSAILELTGSGDPPRRGAKSLGDQFVESDLGKWLVETKGQRPQRWASPSVELKAVLAEGALLPPTLLPTIAPGPSPAPTVAQLLARGTTDAAALAFLRETLFTNAAAPTAEGASKPEATLTFEQAEAALRKIAHWLPCTEEILDDVPAMRSYVDARLRHGVEVKLDDQLLNGDGVAPNLLGILNTPGLATAIAQGTDTAADAIARQIAAITTAQGLAPDALVLNPTDYIDIQLAKDDAGGYLGDGPFAAPGPPTLWGRPVALTSAIAANTVLVGCFATAAQLFVKGGIRVDVSNSHADYFIKNLVAIRAEVRAALALYRPGCFGVVTLT